MDFVIQHDFAAVGRCTVGSVGHKKQPLRQLPRITQPAETSDCNRGARVAGRRTAVALGLGAQARARQRGGGQQMAAGKPWSVHDCLDL